MHMAAIQPGTYVQLQQSESEKLAYPPPTLDLQVTVHRLAIPKSGKATPLTTLLHRNTDEVIDWIGSIDERMLSDGQASGQSPRSELNQYLFNHSSCWDVIRPGHLIEPKNGTPYLTVYDGDRPWVVIGELPNGSLLAVPLNDARGNPKWYAPQIKAEELNFQNAKLSQMELAHIWSFPATLVRIGNVEPAAVCDLQQECLKYFS